jgi:hypothetical protein
VIRGRHELVVATAAVADWAVESEYRTAWLAHCLARHLAADWGDLDPDDRRANDHAIGLHDGRLLSRYDLPAWLAADAQSAALWIITDDVADPDTATTLLWPSDY